MLFGLVFVAVSIFFGDELLGIVGDEYVDAATLLSLLLFAASFELASASLRAAAYAMGKAGSILRIHIVSIITYILMFFILTPVIGLNGPGLAAILASLLATVLTRQIDSKKNFTSSLNKTGYTEITGHQPELLLLLDFARVTLALSGWQMC